MKVCVEVLEQVFRFQDENPSVLALLSSRKKRVSWLETEGFVFLRQYNMVLDRDSIFIPIVHRVLPSMGITVRRIGLKCPWQNGVVERFHRTMQEELLDYVIPTGEAHLSRLLQEYREF